MIDLSRDDDVFTLTMNAGENRWNTTFVREFSEALEEVEASSGPAALVTRSTDPKFFSNGLDLDWVSAPEDHLEGGDRVVFGAEFMALAGRVITLPVPTVCAINGHAFGAGLMIALCHDVRIQRSDRGFICANEMQLGLKIPTPELALFRHKIPMNAFFETVQLARRWTGPDALAAGLVQAVAEIDDLLPLAEARAKELAPLGANRELYGGQKERLYGENAVLNGPHGAAHMLKHLNDYQ
ncbi:MAG: enoyl-CoA hydratase/isomerase family protein [Gammaproteobacteria bacterium]|nr:enoyl-CoA hydratase/isomerase family protein [Gammaproteobacteria bacterium]